MSQTVTIPLGFHKSAKLIALGLLICLLTLKEFLTNGKQRNSI
jgi:hypothetical protein